MLSAKESPGTWRILFQTKSIILQRRGDLLKQPNFALAQFGGRLMVDGGWLPGAASHIKSINYLLSTIHD
jgi:hypothetical protein